MLIGPLSGFLSLTPAVGVPLALVPPLLSALAVYSTPAPYLIIVAVEARFHSPRPSISLGLARGPISGHAAGAGVSNRSDGWRECRSSESGGDLLREATA